MLTTPTSTTELRSEENCDDIFSPLYLVSIEEEIICNGAGSQVHASQ